MLIDTVLYTYVTFDPSTCVILSMADMIEKETWIDKYLQNMMLLEMMDEWEAKKWFKDDKCQEDHFTCLSVCHKNCYFG